MKYLFIGGHHDGQRIEIGDYPPPRYCLPIYPKIWETRYDEPSQELNVEGFNAMPFAADGGRFIVYALDGMSPYQALQALIERYPAHESPSP